MASNPSRPFVHARLARKESFKPSYVTHWIRKIQAEGREYNVLILEELSEHADRKFLGEVEKMYISALRKVGHRLTNATDGGEGCLNPSPEFRTALSERNRGNQYGLGKKRSEKTRQKMRESRARVLAAHPEIGDAISQRNIGNTYGKATAGRIVSDETRSRISQTKRGSKATDETKRLLSESHTGLKATDDTRQKLRDGWTTERRASVSAKMREIKLAAGAVKRALKAAQKESEESLLDILDKDPT